MQGKSVRTGAGDADDREGTSVVPCNRWTVALLVTPAGVVRCASPETGVAWQGTASFAAGNTERRSCP
ncbi:hypothetical protein [Streptomyces sp. CC77]|uniref:hypothetical protein n=1 Tax=Streptomyces sp. CC77 TaxID=1906739 RepID=UPI001113EECC|nr:hypothetical protein [Streptomyces sp. CC77]